MHIISPDLAIQNFQQRLYTRYKQSLSLPASYRYLYGSPVQPVVPLDTACSSVFIVGAYPPARTIRVDNETHVPIADSSRPFAEEIYFDGYRVRGVSTGVSLEEAYLAGLQLDRSQCWITNLVRVFLFSDTDLIKYRRLGCPWPEYETASHFEQLAVQSRDWLIEELHLAQPKLILALGEAVAMALRRIQGQPAHPGVVGSYLTEFRYGTSVYPIVYLPHPATINTPQRWRLHQAVYLPKLRQLVKDFDYARS